MSEVSVIPTTENYGLKKPTLIDSAFIDDLNGNADIIDGALKENADAIAANAEGIEDIQDDMETMQGNVHAELAYVATELGGNWLLPAGTDAEKGEFIVRDGVLGRATDTITGGVTVITPNTNWTAVAKGGLNSMLESMAPEEVDGWTTPAGGASRSYTYVQRVGQLILISFRYDDADDSILITGLPKAKFFQRAVVVGQQLRNSGVVQISAGSTQLNYLKQTGTAADIKYGQFIYIADD